MDQASCRLWLSFYGCLWWYGLGVLVWDAVFEFIQCLYCAWYCA